MQFISFIPFLFIFSVLLSVSLRVLTLERQ